jgi:energy-coupling factor transporter ATP-binding protein EcfA2
MSKKRIWIKGAKLQRSPGFQLGEFPSIDEFSERLNIVWGPNGVGKSSLANALCSLLWNRQVPKSVEAFGTLETPDGQWRLERSLGKLRQIRLEDNGVLELPGRRDAWSDSYWFPLHALLQESETGQAFLERVRKDMHGGKDVQSACREAGGIDSWVGSRNGKLQAYKQAVAAYEDTKAAQEKLKDLRREIGELEGLLQAVPDLRKEQRLLQEALELKNLDEEIGRILAMSEQYPSQMDRVDARSLERARQLESEKEEKETELGKVDESLADLRSGLADCGIDERQFGDVALEQEIRTLLAAWQQAVSELKNARTELEKRSAKVQTWEELHGWLLQAAPEGEGLEQKVARLKKIAGQCEQVRCDYATATKYVESLGDAEPDLSDDELLGKIRVKLDDWVSKELAVRSMPTGRVVSSRLAMVLGLLSFAGAAVAPLLRSLWAPLWGLGSVLLGLGIWRWLSRYGTVAGATEAKVQEEALRTEIDRLLEAVPRLSLSAWTVEGATELEGKISALLNEQVAVRNRNEQRKKAALRLGQSKSVLQDWEQEWKAACDDLGIDMGNTTLAGAEFYHFSAQLKTWTDLVAEEAAGRQEAEAKKREHDRALAALQKASGIDSADPARVQAVAENFIERLDKAHRVRKDIDAKTRERENLVLAVERKRKEWQAFWDALDLEAGDEVALQQIVSRLEEWNKLQTDKTLTEGKRASILETCPEAGELAGSGEMESMQARLEEIGRRLQEAEEMRQHLADKKARLKMLESGSDLATAKLQKDNAAEALDRLRRENLLHRVVKLLADRIAEETEKTTQPFVMTKANEWMGRITNGRYRLKAVDDGFLAFDVNHGKNLALDELSSGTRVQLLFAVRMAFIESLEMSDGICYPVFLDELLANSDDERAMAITDAIQEISKERQVFYFTAQYDEVQKLRSLEVPHAKVLPLGDIRQTYELEQNPRTPFSFVRPAVPEADPDYERYGTACKVPGPSLWTEVSDLHAWYLETDSERLRQLLVKGVEKAGSAARWFGDRRPELKKRLSLLQQAQRLARKGRCRPLHPGDLADESLQVNRTAGFWKQIESLTAAGTMTGNDLIAAFDDKKKVSNLRKNRQVIEDWLYEKGFATTEQPIPNQEILARLAAADPSFTTESDDWLVVSRYLDGVTGPV